ncbi:hypothetical protein JW933_06970 [candidate division FCPU426 bacterium]|nr:hypothetical protein [candidate division FCPU426 bacterium]
MQVDRRKIESNLPSKGFVVEDTHHKYFYHEIQGKRTGIYTYISHGAKNKTYGDSLLKMMKTQLKLNTIRDVADLCNCPMSKEDYNRILKDKGAIGG